MSYVNPYLFIFSMVIKLISNDMVIPPMFVGICYVRINCFQHM